MRFKPWGGEYSFCPNAKIIIKNKILQKVLGGDFSLNKLLPMEFPVLSIVKF